MHPSGRLALSIGEGGKKAKLWNLLTGKVAVLFKLDKGLDTCLTVPSEKGVKLHQGRDFRDLPLFCKWSPSGDFWAAQWTTQIDVFSSSGSTKLPVKSVATDSRVTSFCWVSEDEICVGTEEGQVIWISLSSASVIRKEVEETRVKEVTTVGGAVVVATSAGVVKRYGASVAMLALDDRLTCMCSTEAAAPIDEAKPSKKKKSKPSSE